MKTRLWSPPLVAALALCCFSSVAAAQVAATDDPPPSPDKSPPDGVEHLRVGVVGGVGFPRPLAIEAMVKLERRVAVGIEYSAMPTLTIAGVDTTSSAVAGDLSIFPFDGPFFFGAKLGRQHLSASTTLTVASYGTFSESLTYDEWFLNPRLGLLWTTRFGLTLGFDVGVQIPITSSSSTTIPSSVMSLAAVSDVTSVTSRFGAGVLPTVDLLRAGFLF